MIKDVAISCQVPPQALHTDLVPRSIQDCCVIKAVHNAVDVLVGHAFSRMQLALPASETMVAARQQPLILALLTLVSSMAGCLRGYV